MKTFKLKNILFKKQLSGANNKIIFVSDQPLYILFENKIYYFNKIMFNKGAKFICKNYEKHTVILDYKKININSIYNTLSLVLNALENRIKTLNLFQ